MAATQHALLLGAFPDHYKHGARPLRPHSAAPGPELLVTVPPRWQLLCATVPRFAFHARATRSSSGPVSSLAWDCTGHHCQPPSCGSRLRQDAGGAQGPSLLETGQSLFRLQGVLSLGSSSSSQPSLLLWQLGVRPGGFWIQSSPCEAGTHPSSPPRKCLWARRPGFRGSLASRWRGGPPGTGGRPRKARVGGRQVWPDAETGRWVVPLEGGP